MENQVQQTSSSRPFAEYIAEVCEHADVRHGFPLPLGTYEFEGGVNFALFSRDATRVRLEFFAAAEDSQADRVVDLDPTCNRTGDIWHVWIKDIRPGQMYAYRVNGPHQPEAGQLFGLDSPLLDPCATAIKRPRAGHVAPKCVFTSSVFNWRDDQPPRHPWSQTLIYETHVRGFTAHSSSQVRFPGTFRGVTEKIPYLKDLGITAIELQPVQQLDDPIAFFAPNAAYSSAGDCGEQVVEFKEMVRQLHAAGIEVILDIVLNHTDESGEHGATLSWRGLNANHPVARQFIVSALRYWVVEMHVDGFRFDLASMPGRGSPGQLPLLEQIADDSVLGNTKLIAKAWDATGTYQAGSFSERRWAEWNGRYRDDVRRFWRGDEGMLGAFASRICGSEDLYGARGKGPGCSINFVSCHECFTLNDLLSCEGPTQDPRIERARQRQIKNFLLTLFISRGVPMLLGGDEFRRTQQGNNANRQHDDVSCYNWAELNRNADIHEFVKRIIAFRRAHPMLSREEFYTPAAVSWFTPVLTQPDWSDPGARTLGCLIHDNTAQDFVCLLFNAEDKPMSFRIPPPPPLGGWKLALDTATDLPASGAEPWVPAGSSRTLESRSSVVLVSIPSEPCTVKTVGCDPAIETCAEAMGGDDPAAAYAAAMLWYQGYPDPPRGPTPAAE